MTGSNARGRLARAQELRVHKQREKEYTNQEVLQYYGEQKNLDAAAANALRDDVRRRDREGRERQGEQNIVENIYRTEKTKELLQQRTQEENQLATAVLTQHAEQQREAGEVANLHKNNVMLRDLAGKLKTAQVSRERALQLQEIQLIEAQQKDYTTVFDAALERDRVAALAEEQRVQWNRRMANIDAREVLKEQMEERVEMQRQAKEDHEAERMMIDEVMRAINAEDRLAVELKHRKAAETVEYIRHFIEERDKRRLAQRQADWDEERKIQDHLTEMKRRDDAKRAALAAQREEADKIYVRLKAEKEVAMAAKDEEEFLINLLRQEENEAKQAKKVADRKDYEARMKHEMIEANMKQMEMKAARERAMRDEEEDYRLRMMEKFAEDDRIEQMNAQRRRMKTHQHRVEVERLIADKRRMFEEAKRDQERWEQIERLKDDREVDLVERERRKLLRDAAPLLDYLPKGVLRNREDLDYVLDLAQELKSKGSITGDHDRVA